MNKIFACTLFLIGSCFTANAQTYSFVHDSVSRSYIVHLPPSYTPCNTYPLVINMHGYGSAAAQEQFYTEMDAVADTANFIVVYPNGVANSWNSGQTWSYNQGIDDVSFISALIDTIAANYSIDTTMVYACGMSNGGYMSYRLACELENKIAAIASVTGVMSDSIYNNCQTDRPVPILHMHGTADPTVAYNGTPGNTAVETGIDWWVQNNNCPGTPTITNIPDLSMTDGCTVDKYFYGPCDFASEVVLFKIIGGEHTWPGVSIIIGVTNQDIDGSGEIWKFFRRHQMPNTTIPLSPAASFSWIDNGGGFATFTDLSTNMPTCWTWDFGDGNTATTQNPTNNYFVKDSTYTVCLTATNSVGSDINCNSVYIADTNLSPVALFSWIDNGGGFTTFTDLSTNMPTFWTWDFGDGNTSTTQNPTNNYFVKDSTYNVCLTATNSVGSDSYCDSVFAADTIIVLPVIESATNTLTIAFIPNPVSYTTTIHLANDVGIYGIDLLLFNAMGQEVLRKYVKSNSNGYFVINLQSLRKGIYFYYLKEKGSNRMGTGKLVVE
ncbi:MAG TPA: T9SS type A sorting domain-containing protein [Flavobacteriales bacterium]|nr:T9SS type A sorting domain-containing protein [Flavobacteriales bacterium]